MRASFNLSDRVLLAVALPILLGMLALQVVSANHRNLDSDELEHLNGAYFISRGETMYGTFFENHPPFTAMLLQPVVRSSDVPEDLIHRGRWLMLVLSFGILAATARLAWHAGGWTAAVVAAMLLLIHPFYFQKTLEVRPDVPAIFLLTVGIAILMRGASARNGYWLAAAGAILCCAGLFTPKVIFVAAGATVATIVTVSRRAPNARTRAAVVATAWIAAGAGVVAAVTAAELARRGVLSGFLSDAVGMSLHMRIDDVAAFRHSYLKAGVTVGAGTWILAAIGTWLLQVTPKRWPAGYVEILCWSLAGGLIGLFLTAVPLRQFFVAFWPPLAALAGCGATLLGRWVAARAPALLTTAAMVAVVVFATQGSVRAALAPQPTMDTQLQTINTVLALTDREDRVLDGGGGLYLTRLPAYRYFYLNSDVLRLLPPDELIPGVLAALRHPRVKVVFLDDSLPAPIRDAMREGFAPIPDAFGARVRR